MKKLKEKYIDKFAHLGAGAIMSFVFILTLSLLTINVVVINALTFVFVSALAIFLEFLDGKKGFGKVDKYDALATIIGMGLILIMYNF